MKNGQSRETVNTGHIRHRMKTNNKKNTVQKTKKMSSRLSMSYVPGIDGFSRLSMSYVPGIDGFSRLSMSYVQGLYRCQYK
jgi:hypothetical protein